ncbi:DUF2306 domain-containing protein [Novosphingobium sp.]|uniref:DUF2306 domain-containing protein n=1 Tax=Novosphingobium sp. TaxID=1874826 RepID=UPI003BA8E5DC
MAAETLKRAEALAPDRLERVLGWAALVLLAAALAAIVRGHAGWGSVPFAIWLHLATVIIALTLTPVILWQKRGTRLHRRLGTIWAGAMFISALDSFWILETNHGHFSVIHLLSAFVAVQTPRLVLTARRHDHVAHRRTVRGLVIGGLLTAGALTFPFHRLLGRWLFG